MSRNLLDGGAFRTLFSLRGARKSLPGTDREELKKRFDAIWSQEFVATKQVWLGALP